MRPTCVASLLLIAQPAQTAAPASSLLACSSSSQRLPSRRLSLAATPAEPLPAALLNPPPFLLASLLPRSETIRRWRAETEAESIPIIRVFAAPTHTVPPSTETLLQLFTNASKLSPSDYRFRDAVVLGDQGFLRTVGDLTRPKDLLDLLDARLALAKLAQGSSELSDELQKLVTRKVASLSFSADEAAHCLRLLSVFECQPRASLLQQLEDQALADLQQKALENTSVAASALSLFAAFSLYRHRFRVHPSADAFLLRHLKKASYKNTAEIFSLLEALANYGGKSDDLLSFLERRALPVLSSFTGPELVRYLQLVEKIRAPYTPQVDFLDAFYLQVHQKLGHLSLADIESLMNFYLQLFHWKPSVFHLRELEQHLIATAKQHASRDTLPRTSLLFEQCSIKPVWTWGP